MGQSLSNFSLSLRRDLLQTELMRLCTENVHSFATFYLWKASLLVKQVTPIGHSKAIWQCKLRNLVANFGTNASDVT